MRTRPVSKILITVLLLTALGCTKPEPKMSPEDAAKLTAMWSERVGDALKEQAASSASSEALEALFKANATRAEEEANRRAEPPFEALASEVYEARKFKTGFMRKGALTPAGEAVLQLLRQVDHDALDPEPYQVTKIEERLSKLDSLAKEYAALGGFKPSDAERSALTAWITAQPEGSVAISEETLPKLTEQLMGQDAGQPLRDTIKRYEDLSDKMASLQAEIERGLATGFLRYAHVMRDSYLPESFVHERHDDLYNDPELKLKRPDKAKGDLRAGQTWRQATFVVRDMAKHRGVAILRDRMKRRLTTILDAEQPDAELAALIPSEHYTGLRREYLRYRDIVQAGGWKEVAEVKSLAQGQRSPAVRLLKERLDMEGYLPKGSTIDELFDANLTDAIKTYQDTHQMSVTGKIDRSFWRSLNTPADKRLEQIKLNMERWRKTNIMHREQETYVLVNLPDFHAEIWKQQELKMRIRVVIGNNDKVTIEETGEVTTPNRTPMLSAYIDRVIYNPYWNITPRIRNEETLVEVRKDTEKRYIAKMEKLLAAEPPRPSTAAALLGGPTDAQPEGPSPISRIVTKTKEGQVFNVNLFKQLYAAKHGGAEPDIATLFPYLSAETNMVDVSVTKPGIIPEWYAANNHEVMYPGRDFEYIRQLPGDANSLGRVKVIFPNLHDVYLHDTPHKGLFGLPIRASSHGCMRMHKPLDVAQWLLENDGSFNAKEIKDKLKENVYHPVFLKHRVPVHIEYYTVRVNEQGRAVFLIDIYSRDQQGS